MYDPTDEKTDALFDTLLGLLRGVPDPVAKQGLARLFEQTALFQILASRAGAPLDAEALDDALADLWEGVEARRNELAADALNAIQMQEF